MQTGIEMRLAVLIDADNVPHDKVTGMFKEIARYGTPTIKRIYGDWTKPDLKGWKNLLLTNAITPIQQYRYTVGKNSTDSAMIIEAMDMLYAGNVDGFFIVSSDSDFTRLALRLRESGKKVFGMGERKTPKPFIVACDKFTYIEIIDMPAEKPVLEPVPARRATNVRTAAAINQASVKMEAQRKPESAAAVGKPESVKPEPGKPESGKSESGKTDVERVPHGSLETGRAESVQPPDSKSVSEKTTDAKPETASSGRQVVAKGRNRYDKKPVRVESKPANASAVPATTTDVPEAAVTREMTESAFSGNTGESANIRIPTQADTAADSRHPLVEDVTREIVDLIATSITDLADENGWAFLGDVGTLIAKKKPDFDPRNYGFVKLTPLVRSLDMFELDIRETSQFHIKHVYVRNRKNA